MGQNVEPIQPFAGVEAINKNSALHKALVEMQHWQRCSKLLQTKLNEIEDRNAAYNRLRWFFLAQTLCAFSGWGLAMYLAFTR